MSEEALKRIAECKRIKARKLDLSNLGLEELPMELEELTWLEELDLSRNPITPSGKSNSSFGDSPLGPLAPLTAMRTLRLWNTQVADISPLKGMAQLQSLDLSGTQIVDISSLEGMLQLQELYLSGTKVTDITPLFGMVQLQTLDLSGIQVADISPLREMEQMEELDLGGTLVADISPLNGLTELRTLNLTGTPLADISPLRGLANVQTLFLSRTRVADISPLNGMTNLKKLYLHTTPIVDISPINGMEKLQELHLHNTAISEISALQSVIRLERLDISSTLVADISSIGDLSQMQILVLSATKVRDIKPLGRMTLMRVLNLSDTEVDDIAPLNSMEQLETLNLLRTKIVDISPLSGKLELKSLVLAVTETADISPLLGMAKMKSLDLAKTKVADISPLREMTQLQEISLFETEVADISPLIGMAQLKLLDLRGTKVADISPLRELIEAGRPVKLSDFDYSDSIFLQDCPLTNPPIEITRQGNAAILQYWSEQEFTTLHEAKVLLVGDPNSGKTTLIRRMTWPEMVMPGAGDRTRGIDIHEMKYPLPDGKEMRLNVWDFAGQEVRHATHQFFFTERSIYVLLDDTSENHEGESDPYFRRWLHWIRLMGGESPVLIFQNEKDSKSRGIRFKEIQAQFPLVEELHRGDLALVGSADAFKAALQARALRLGHMGSRWPVKWVRIRELLEQEAQKEPIITYRRFMGICKEAKEDDPKSVAILAKFFHDLGVLLHYHEDEFLREWVIIDNQWATDAVYLLMTDEEVKQLGRGRFGLEDLGRIWAEERFLNFLMVLTSLMERFDLCYPLKDTQPRQWLIPQMLGPSSPDALEFRAEGGDLVVDYCYDFAPKGLVNRLMTRHHLLVQDPEMAWKSGVMFEDGHASLLATYDGLKETIHLRAKGGRLDQLALMRSVSRELESIHGLFRNIVVDKLLPCACAFCKTQPFPAMYPMKELLERLERNPGSRKQCGNPKNHDETLVPVRELLNGFWGETMANGKPSGLSAEDREFFVGELGKVRRHFDDRFDSVDETLGRIEVFTEAIPQVMNRLIGVKEYQGTIFQDLKAMAHRLDEKVSANQEDSQAILARIEEALAAVMEAMSPEQRAELDSATPKDHSYLKTVLGKIKFKVPIIPLAYAIISGWEPASLALLGTALSRSLELDATIPEQAKALVRVWDDLKFRVANLILPRER